MKKIKRMEKFDLISNIIVFILAIFFVLPLLWLITNSFKTSANIYKMPPDILPKNVYFGNFTEL
ncbi:carbohydrate ABC transporter permease, partial [Enterococcus faecalis]